MEYLISFLGAPETAYAATTLKDVAQTVAKVVDTATILLINVTLVMYMYGGVKRVFDMSKGKVHKEELWKFFGSGLLIIFVMLSIWGIMEYIQATLNTVSGTPPLPTNGVIQYQ